MGRERTACALFYYVKLKSLGGSRAQVNPQRVARCRTRDQRRSVGVGRKWGEVLLRCAALPRNAGPGNGLRVDFPDAACLIEATPVWPHLRQKFRRVQSTEFDRSGLGDARMILGQLSHWLCAQCKVPGRPGDAETLTELVQDEAFIRRVMPPCF